VLVDVEWKLIKPGIVEKGVTDWICLPVILCRNQENAPWIIIRLFEGAGLKII